MEAPEGSTGPTGRPYVLAEASWPQLRGAPTQLAVLPWGATEPHNRHLPYGTDTYQVEHVAHECAKRAWEFGARVRVLPSIPFGVQTGQLDLPLALNVNPSTQGALLRDLVESLEGQGVRRLVILNGHGGNDFRALMRELLPRTGVFLCVVDWWRVVDPGGHFEEPGDHAGELETSVMLHLYPCLVGPLGEAGPGRARAFRVRGLREGWAWTPRRWRDVTRDTGVGNPRGASADKGRAYLTEVIERVSELFVELASTDPDRLYEGWEEEGGEHSEPESSSGPGGSRSSEPTGPGPGPDPRS